MTPLASAPELERIAARAGYFAQRLGERRVVPSEHNLTDGARQRWLQGFDGAAYIEARARTAHRTGDRRRD